MARLNSRQARAAKRRAALNALAKDRNWTLQVEGGKVRDSVVSKQHLTNYAGPRGLNGGFTPPRFTDEDIPGKRKPKVHAKPVDKSLRQVDSQRDKLARTFRDGVPIREWKDGSPITSKTNKD